MTTSLKIPKLRFKEFSWEWKNKNIWEIFDRIIEKNKENNLNSLTISAQMWLVNQENYFNKLVSSNDLTWYYLLKKWDFAYNKSYSKWYPLWAIKRLNIYDKWVVSTLYICFRIKKWYSNNFFEQYFNSQKQNHSIHKIAQEWARNHGLLNIAVWDFFNIKIYFPEILEQEKISDFLYLVDKKINYINDKKENLENYKKWIIQRIFKQEIKFKDENWNNFWEWKETTLNKVFKERKVYSSKWLDLPHISLTTQWVVPKSERYERDYLVMWDDKQYKVTRLWDICYNPANLKFWVITRNKLWDWIFSPIYVTFEVIWENDVNFIEYFVTRKDFINRARKYEEWTVYERMAVKPSDFLKLEVELPTQPEQKKIAKFLWNIDKKIEKTKEELVELENFKKWLLQNMFI